ncbi:hypothetical protein A4H97_33415 [Niastella yeongjuensis]|uniref:Knr4/Smi1-like domain-containing protein n=1 Tax=Niastella yeongjuensis TaxID=354355 RepID=A0A1V9EE68_9BACT|nr:SMI1/KNR4 family protein [Niastella yeongjuensis]OQP44254.1 hypothetical protein A4H97_33415 [Niastella yeongjuensis]SEO41315.1 SMI1 / KNR4 family (SUKH-1) [Niastella yeongjuensis]
MKPSEFRQLNNSIDSFKRIKQESEKLWEKVELEECWGFQIQEGSKWKKGLTEEELLDFERQLGFRFPDSLKNFLRTMNGLDRPGINHTGNDEDTEYGPTFYSYPEDIEKIKGQIEWVLEDNKVSELDLLSGKVPYVFPYLGHRCLVCDKNQNVLSMHGNDIIYWGVNLSQGIAHDIWGFWQKTQTKYPEVSFWNNIAEKNS